MRINRHGRRLVGLHSYRQFELPLDGNLIIFIWLPHIMHVSIAKR